MRTLDVSLLPKQLELVQYDGLWGGVMGGVGCGKSTGYQWWILQRAIKYPKAVHAVCGSDYEQLRRPGSWFDSFVGLLEEVIGLEAGKDFRYIKSPTPKVILTRLGGGKIHSLSAANLTRNRGSNIQSLVCEEPQSWWDGADKGYEAYQTLDTRLRHSLTTAKTYGDTLKPQGRLCFNPPVVSHWLYDLIEQKWRKAGYQCWRMSLRENTLLEGHADFVARLESNLPEDLWPAEIDGEWRTLGGKVYKYYSRERHAQPASGLPPLAFDPSKPLLWALDFNVNLMCSVVAQIHWQSRVVTGYENTLQVGLGQRKPITSIAVSGYQEQLVYILDELRMADSGMYDVTAQFLERHGEMAKRTGVILYGDASGVGKSQQLSSATSARTNWDIAIEELRKAGIRVELYKPGHNPSVVDRVNMMNAQLYSARTGIGMVIDHNKCPYLVRDFQSVSWKEGTSDLNKTTDKTITHLSDALGYLVHYERKRAALPDPAHIASSVAGWMER